MTPPMPNPSRAGVYRVLLESEARGDQLAAFRDNRVAYWTGDHWRTVDLGLYGDDRIADGKIALWQGPLEPAVADEEPAAQPLSWQFDIYLPPGSGNNPQA